MRDGCTRGGSRQQGGGDRHECLRNREPLQRNAPLFEPGLAELLKQGQAKGKLRFTTDLFNLAQHRSPRELAEQACAIEMSKQDQHIAAFGGITCFMFQRNGVVDAATLAIDDEFSHALEDNLLLFFTDFSRAASSLRRHVKPQYRCVV
jgi:hypothetical protein